MRDYTQRPFVANLSYLFGYSWGFGTAALEGVVGMLQGARCRVWAANLNLHARTALDLKPMSQAACFDFKKMY